MASGCSSCTSDTISSTAQNEFTIELHDIIKNDDGSHASQYRLNIHHRVASVNDARTDVTKSPTGHFFVSLQKNDEHIFYGKYSQGGGLIKIIFGLEKIESKKEEELFYHLKELEKINKQKYLHTKTFYLTEDQYDNALKYANKKVTGEIPAEKYILGGADCADFAQCMYYAVGLHLYFSSAFSRKELTISLAGRKVLYAYNTLEQFNFKFEKISASNRKELSDKLNIHEDRIIPFKDGTFFVDIDDALEELMNQQDLYTSTMDRLFLNTLRMVNAYEMRFKHDQLMQCS